MPWAALPDDLHVTPEAFGAGGEALGLFALVRSWISQALTDGRVPRATALGYARALGIADPDAAIDRLLCGGLWRKVSEVAYEDVRYLENNPSRDRVQAKKAMAKRRQADWRSRSEGVQMSDENASMSHSNASRNASLTRVSRGRNAPSPSPTQTQIQNENPEARAHAPAREGVPKGDGVEGGPEPEAPATKTARVEESHARYAACYSRGIAAETGEPHGVLSSHERAALAALLPVHAREAGRLLRLGELDAWLEAKARAFVRARRHIAAMQRGYSPQKFGEWLNEGCPPAPPVNGHARPAAAAAPGGPPLPTNIHRAQR